MEKKLDLYFHSQVHDATHWIHAETCALSWLTWADPVAINHTHFWENIHVDKNHLIKWLVIGAELYKNQIKTISFYPLALWCKAMLSISYRKMLRINSTAPLPSIYLIWFHSDILTLIQPTLKAIWHLYTRFFLVLFTARLTWHFSVIKHFIFFSRLVNLRPETLSFKYSSLFECFTEVRYFGANGNKRVCDCYIYCWAFCKHIYYKKLSNLHHSGKKEP